MRDADDEYAWGASFAREILERIAVDEERHAALAWRTVAWAPAQGGSDVAAAVRHAATRARPTAEVDSVTTPSLDPELARRGRLDGAAQADVVRTGWRDAIEPLCAALLAGRVDVRSPAAATLGGIARA